MEITDFFFWLKFELIFLFFFCHFHELNMTEKVIFTHSVPLLFIWFYCWNNEGEGWKNLENACQRKSWFSVWLFDTGMLGKCTLTQRLKSTPGTDHISQTCVLLYHFIGSTSSVTMIFSVDSKMKLVKTGNTCRSLKPGPPPRDVKEPQGTKNKKNVFLSGLKWKSFLQMAQHHSLLSLWKCKIYCTKVRIKTVKTTQTVSTWCC